MGILKKITDEYFGEKLRKEDSDVLKFMNDCIKNNDRERFANYFKEWDVDGKNCLVFKTGESVDDVSITTEEKAYAFLRHCKDDVGTGGYLCLMKEVFLATPDTYRNIVHSRLNGLPKPVSDFFQEIFECFCRYPEHITLHLIMDMKPKLEHKTDIYPGEVEIMNTYDVFIKGKRGGECVIVTTPSFGNTCFDNVMPFTDMTDLVVRMNEVFEENGYKRSHDPTKFSVCPYMGSYSHIFVKKQKRRK